MIAEVPACDWLTLTTFCSDTLRLMKRVLVRVMGEGAESWEGKRMQYVGQQGDGWFLGQGDQGGNAHHMLQVSGASADKFLKEWATPEGAFARVNCSRIDLQITTEPEDALCIPILGEALRASEGSDWSRRGGKPSVSYISNDGGLDTLYVGSRKSERFYRIYMKDVGAERYCRFEVEFKGDAARAAYERVLGSGKGTMGAVIGGEIQTFPHVAKFALRRHMARLVVHADRLLVASGETDAQATLRWLYEAVLPSLARVSKSLPRRDIEHFGWEVARIVAGE